MRESLDNKMHTYNILSICVLITLSCGQSKFERFVEGSDLLQVPSEMQQVRTNKNCGVPNRENITSINEMELLFNTFRRNMNSSAMFTMKWNPELAIYAQAKTDKCDFRLKLPETCTAKFYTSYGSALSSSDNVYPKVDTADFLSYYFDGIINYDPATNICNKGKCFYVRKFALDNLARFACASTKCDILTLNDGNTIQNAVYGVCYIARGRGLAHVAPRSKPFSTDGKPCDKCSKFTDAGVKCNNGLCVSCSGSDCECDMTKTCKPNEIFNKDTCKCECKKGYVGIDCECDMTKKCNPYEILNKDTCKCECRKGYFGEYCYYPCICIDTSSKCISYMKVGYCQSQVNFMRRNCSASCKNACESVKPEEGLNSCK